MPATSAWSCRTTRCSRTCASTRTSRSACARGAPRGRHRRARARLPAHGGHVGLRAALSARAFGRPAAARGDRARAGDPAAGAAARRTAVGARCADPPLDAGRAGATASRPAAPDGALRHARPDRGADACRSHRHHARRQAGRVRPLATLYRNRRTASPRSSSAGPTCCRCAVQDTAGSVARVQLRRRAGRAHASRRSAERQDSLLCVRPHALALPPDDARQQLRRRRCATCCGRATCRASSSTFGETARWSARRCTSRRSPARRCACISPPTRRR